MSCAEKISIFSKTSKTDYVGGLIDNSQLDAAIKSDLTPENYPLGGLDFGIIRKEIRGHSHGTIIYFQNTKEHIRSSIDYLKKLIAMNFRFSLVDKNFKIFVNNQLVTIADLSDLSASTEFWWSINSFSDEFTSTFAKSDGLPINITTKLNVSGFLATVKVPRNLKIIGTEERATVDLFVNGRLREKNITRHIPTQRIIESYLYGQIHFDHMDKDGSDPFTSSREGIKEEDKDFQALLEFMRKKLLPKVIDDWDKLRLTRGEDGDEENTSRASRKQRRARSLYFASTEDYEPDKKNKNRDTVDKWLEELAPDAEFNISSYVDCFLSENLVRKYIEHKKISLNASATKAIADWRVMEAKRLKAANISYPVRRDKSGLSYLDLDAMVHQIDGGLSVATEASLVRDAITYKPVRNVVGHTGLLTTLAKKHLNITFENMKGRVRTLLSGKKK